MKLIDKINTQTIISHLKSESKKDVIHELLDHFHNLEYLTSTVKLFSYLDDKEKQFNSASGRGVAYHYHTSIEVEETLAVLGISKKGIDYNAADGLRCHFILMILEPKNKPNKHRILINLFQNLIKNSNIKSKLLELNSNQDVEDVIRAWEKNEENNNDVL